MNSTTKTGTFPIIDISDIADPSHRLAIAEKITAATAEWGFLLLSGHPIPIAEVNEMFTLSHDFFLLEESKKEPWPLDTATNLGYIGSLKDLKKDDKMSMWFGGPSGALIKSKEQLPLYWHDHLARLEDFKSDCHKLVLQLLECFALALDLPEPDFFAKAHDPSLGKGNSLRMLFYPARSEKPEGSTRMQPHTDSGSVTLLFQQNPGLEVLSPEDKWVAAPCIDEMILINIGDTLAFWSGGQLKATKHRVTFDSLSNEKERQSMAYFGTAAPDTVLEPVVARDGAKVQKFGYNGVEIEAGITAGRYGDLIMQNIYGAAPVAVK